MHTPAAPRESGELPSDPACRQPLPQPAWLLPASKPKLLAEKPAPATPCCLQAPVGSPPGLLGASCPSTSQQHRRKARGQPRRTGRLRGVWSSHRPARPAAASDDRQARGPGRFLDRCGGRGALSLQQAPWAGPDPTRGCVAPTSAEHPVEGQTPPLKRLWTCDPLGDGQAASFLPVSPHIWVCGKPRYSPAGALAGPWASGSVTWGAGPQASSGEPSFRSEGKAGHTTTSRRWAHKVPFAAPRWSSALSIEGRSGEGELVPQSGSSPNFLIATLLQGVGASTPTPPPAWELASDIEEREVSLTVTASDPLAHKGQGPVSI